MMHHTPLTKTHWLMVVVLWSVVPTAAYAMNSTNLHVPHLGLSFQIWPDEEMGTRLAVKYDQTNQDLTSQYQAALSCRFSERPEVMDVWNLQAHHQFFTARIRWKCGTTVFDGRLGVIIEPSKLSRLNSSKFDFYFHVFSIQVTGVGCQEALSPAPAE